MKARKRDNQIKAAAVTIVAVVILAAMVLNMLNIHIFDFTKTNSATYTSSGTQTFPYPLDEGVNAHYMKASNDSILLYDANNLSFISPSSGKNTKIVNHFFSEPVVDISGRYVLTYAQGKTKFRIDTLTKEICEAETKQKIISACVAENGAYAIATTAKSGISEATVYSKSLKKLFTWNSTDSYIIDMALNMNGSKLAVAAITSKDAVIQTKVSVIDVKSGETLQSFVYNDSTVMKMKYVSYSSFYVVCDNALYFVENNTDQKQLSEAAAKEIICYDFSKNNELRVVYSAYDTSKKQILEVFNRRGESRINIALSGEVQSIGGASNVICLLFGDKVECYDGKGGLKSTLQLEDKVYNAVYFSNYVYLQTADKILKQAVKGGQK